MFLSGQSFGSFPGFDLPIHLQAAVEPPEIDRLLVFPLQRWIRGFGAQRIHKDKASSDAQSAGCGCIEIGKEPLHVLDADPSAERGIRDDEGDAPGSDGCIPKIAFREGLMLKYPFPRFLLRRN